MWTTILLFKSSGSGTGNRSGGRCGNGSNGSGSVVILVGSRSISSRRVHLMRRLCIRSLIVVFLHKFVVFPHVGAPALVRELSLLLTHTPIHEHPHA